MEEAKFIINRTYPKTTREDNGIIDERRVVFEVETFTPLGDEFYDELSRLVTKYCQPPTF